MSNLPRVTPPSAFDAASSRPGPAPRWGCRATRRRRGFTLAEVMISLVLVGTAALAGLAGMMFTYRQSDANLRQFGALSAARAVAEQISTLDFDTLQASTLPVDLPSSSIGSLTVNTWNARTDDIHGTPSKTSDDLVMSLRPEITLSNTSTLFSCAQVIVRYRWEENAFFTTRIREDSLTLIMSQVESY